MVATDSARPIQNKRELKLLIQQMSKGLRDSEGGGLMERFEAVSKLLFTKIVDEREAQGLWDGSAPKPAEELLAQPGEDDRNLYERARSVWQRVVSSHPQVFAGSRGAFPRDVAGVARILRLLAGFSLSRTASDVKGGAYEEILHNTFEKNENQQYFTPRHVVDFIVGLCQPQPNYAICDPAVGSGGFLVGALTSIAASGANISDVVRGMRGAEVDERMAWIARINMLMHGGDPQSIRHVRGPGALAPLPKLRDALPSDSFDLILTNPPFGSDMTDSVALEAFVTGQRRQSRRRGILFLERCLELLKPGGQLGIVLDDSVLNLPSNADVQRLVRERAIVDAVISLPDVTFMPYSTAKSSILVLRRRIQGETQGLVFMADVENVGNRPNGDPLYGDEYDEGGHRKLKSDLPWVLGLYRDYLAGKFSPARLEGSTIFLADIEKHREEPDGNRLDVFFFHPAREDAERQLARSRFELKSLIELVSVETGAVNPAEVYGDATIRWIGLGDIEALTGSYEIRETPGDRIRSSAHVFRGGDILFSRLRPKLRKVILVDDADEGGVCSAEMLVMRVLGRGSVIPAYLGYMLRSDLVYGQLIYRVTGIGRPRVTAQAIRRLQLPIPPMEVQQAIVGSLTLADREALQMKSEAHRHLQGADGRLHAAYEEALERLK